MQSLSRHLSAAQVRGLERLGDAYIPGDEQLPSFARTGCVEHVDRILDYMDSADLKSLKLLLGVFAYVPHLVIVALVALLETSTRVPGPVGAALRFVRMGIKGLVVSLYYSGYVAQSYKGPSPLDVLGYEVGVYTADVDAANSADTAA